MHELDVAGGDPGATPFNESAEHYLHGINTVKTSDYGPSSGRTNEVITDHGLTVAVAVSDSLDSALTSIAARTLSSYRRGRRPRTSRR